MKRLSSRAFKRFFRAVFVALSIAVIVAPGIQPAAAGTIRKAEPSTIQDTSCEAGYLCFWANIGQGGAKGKLSGNNTAWGSFSQSSCQSGTWDNCASSIINNGRQCTARVWADGGYRGEHLDVLRGNGYIDLTNHYITWPVRTWNDEISSNNWVNCD